MSRVGKTIFSRYTQYRSFYTLILNLFLLAKCFLASLLSGEVTNAVDIGMKRKVFVKADVRELL